jgi:hypothetical protein
LAAYRSSTAAALRRTVRRRGRALAGRPDRRGGNGGARRSPMAFGSEPTTPTGARTPQRTELSGS